MEKNQDKHTEKNVRSYQMGARAQSTTETGERILDAAVEIFYEQPVESISLDKVADRAGYTVQTVIRRFGGKEGLFTAAIDRESKRLSNQRDKVSSDDVEGAIDILLDHYEDVGVGVLRMLAEEHRLPALESVINLGRKSHQEWCEKVFSPALLQLRGEDRKRRLAQFIAITDVYMWNILYLHQGLSREQTKLALKEMLYHLMGGK